MTRQIDPQTLKSLVEVEDIKTISGQALADLVRQDTDIQQSLPDGVCQIDPRNGDRIVYASRRAARPHDNRPAARDEVLPERPCPICLGTMTAVVDLAGLSEGFTFINKNLFPMVYPIEEFSSRRTGLSEAEAGAKGQRSVNGLHFLQWSSSFQEGNSLNYLPLLEPV